MSVRRKIATLLTCGVVLVLAITLSSAGTIALQWDPVPEAAGYRVYYATSAGQYNANDFYQVGQVTEATFSGFQDCTNYFLSVKAFNAAGESDSFSNEISGWARPTIQPTVHTVRQGDQITLEIRGSNFMNGVTIETSNPHIDPSSVSIPQCDTLLVVMNVGPAATGDRAAEIGSFALTVVNPDLVYGEQAGTLEVTLDAARFDFNKSDAITRNRVDGKDLVWMAQVFGMSEPGAQYDPDFDLDGNGFIDGADLSYIVSNMGHCWNGSNWTGESETGWDISSCPQELR